MGQVHLPYVLWDWFVGFCAYWGNIASVLGVVLTGLVYLKARDAVQAAHKAEARLLSVDASACLIESLAELRVMVNELGDAIPHDLGPRCDGIRQKLVVVKAIQSTARRFLEDREVDLLTLVIAQLRKTADGLEQPTPINPPDPARIRSILRTQVEHLIELSTRLKVRGSAGDD